MKKGGPQTIISNISQRDEHKCGPRSFFKSFLLLNKTKEIGSKNAIKVVVVVVVD